MGGLSRKNYKIKEINSEIKLPYLLLDGGNILFKNSRKGPKLTQETMAAEAMMLIYKNMGYAAVNIGPYDLGEGVSFLKNSGSFPWISMNYFTSSDEPVFTPYIIKTLGNFKVGIIGTSGPPITDQEDVLFKSWTEVLPDIVKKISDECDFIILLSALPFEENNRIAALFPSIRLIITASISRGNSPPKLINNSIITQTEKRGKYLGFLTVSNADSKTWEPGKTHNIVQLQRQLKTVNQKIEIVKKGLSQSKKDNVQINRLLEKKKTLQLQIEKFNNKVSGSQDDIAVPTTLNTRLIALTSNIPEDKEVREQVREITRAIYDFNMSGGVKKHLKER